MTEPVVPKTDAGRRPPAQLTNMRLAMQTMLQANDAPLGVPRITIFYGWSGYGKTVAAAHVASYLDALFVTADPVWTQRAMLEAIGRELGISRLERSAPRLLTQIIDQLASDPRPLIIDETDYIVDRDWIEIIRAIHDKAQRAFVSWVRSYAAHAASSIFAVQDLDWTAHAAGWGLLRLPKAIGIKRANIGPLLDPEFPPLIQMILKSPRPQRQRIRAGIYSQHRTISQRKLVSTFVQEHDPLPACLIK